MGVHYWSGDCNCAGVCHDGGVNHCGGVHHCGGVYSDNIHPSTTVCLHSFIDNFFAILFGILIHVHAFIRWI